MGGRAEVEWRREDQVFIGTLYLVDYIILWFFWTHILRAEITEYRIIEET